MTRILLFGGTFDPPHNGHINNLRAAAEAVRPDLVIVMPAGIPPHKAASATPGAVRLAMCRCFADALPGIPVEVSGWEIEQAAGGARSYTVNTMRMLRQKYPGAHLYLAVGTDMLESFTQWREWQTLLRLATIVVQSRERGDDDALQKGIATLRRAGGRVVCAKAAALPCASSGIRGGQYSAQELQNLLPEGVLSDILKYKLYNVLK